MKDIGNIPFSYILKKVSLGWSEVLWGYEHGYLSWSVAIQFAEHCLMKGSENPLEVELAGFTKEQASQVGVLLKKLVGELSKNELEHIKKKWLFILLAWFYDNRVNLSEPLEIVEKIYADFDYPEEIVGFIRYMPPNDGYDPTQYTYEENINRLYKNWGNYLSTAEKAFTKSL